MHQIEKIFEKKINLFSWIIGFLGIIFLRCFIEQFLAFSKPLTLTERTVEYWHNFYFFILSILFIWIFLSLFLKIKPQKLSGMIFFSLFFTLAPPLIDMARTGGQVYWSFYLLSAPIDLWRQYVSFFGHLPSGIVYFGTKITFAAVIVFLAFLIFSKTKSFWKTLIGALVSYTILFFMGAFPSLFFYLYTIFSRGHIAKIHAWDIASFFGAPHPIGGVIFPSLQYTLPHQLDFIFYLMLLSSLIILFFLADRKKFWAIIKNFRLPQLIYSSGMLLIGLGLGFLNYPQNFHLNIFSVLAVLSLFASVFLSWKASVITNDIYDFRIDKISNVSRPLPQGIFTPAEYSQIGLLCFLLAVLGALGVGWTFAVLVITYQILAWMYSAEPFRLKKFPLIATFVSAAASILILFLGYVFFSDNQTIYTLSWRIILLLVITYTISLPIKDFKDIAGDRADHIWTWPVILGEKKARLAVASSLFISYVLSVFFLNEFRLFWWALLFGTLTFLFVTNEKAKPRRLPAGVLGLVSIYTVILVWVAFL